MLCKTIRIHRKDGLPGWLTIRAEDFETSWMREYKEEEAAGDMAGGSAPEPAPSAAEREWQEAAEQSAKRPRARTRKEP
jgi:hypothetical protein